MSREKAVCVHIEQLSDSFLTLGELKSAVDSAYEQHGDVVFADGSYPDDYGYHCHKIYREMTPEEITKEKQDQEVKYHETEKAYQRSEFERIGNAWGWKYE